MTGDKLEHHQTEGTYRKALCDAKTMCNSSPVAENKNNLRFLFSTVATLTESHSSIESSFPATLTRLHEHFY